MRMTFKQLKSLSVETVSGTKLGSVCDLILEIDGQLVAQYEVRTSRFSGEKYLVNRDQVVRFEADRLVVEDGVLREVKKEKRVKRTAANPEPVAMSESKS